MARRLAADERAEAQQIKSDPAIRSGFSRWKPFHFMVFHNQTAMAKELLSLARRKFSIRKAISLENKKQRVGDDVYPLTMVV